MVLKRSQLGQIVLPRPITMSAVEDVGVDVDEVSPPSPSKPYSELFSSFHPHRDGVDQALLHVERNLNHCLVVLRHFYHVPAPPAFWDGDGHIDGPGLTYC